MTNVLIVEDQELNRRYFEIILKESGRYHVARSIPNAALAPFYCQQGGIDLVLMDVYTEMEASGLEAAEIIKQKCPAIKVIIVTSIPEFSWMERAKKAGVESFWYKNVTREPLLELIDLLPADTPKYLIPGDMDGTLVDSGAHGSLSPYADWALRVQAAGVTLLDRPAAETRGKGTIRFVPEEVYMLDLDVTESVYRKQLNALNERAASLTADEAARTRALEYELARLEEIRAVKKEFKPEDIQIVLSHTPLTEEYVQSMVSWTDKESVFSMRYASLILAGHYNGGQWRLPWGKAVYVPEKGWFPEDSEIMGLQYLGDIPQYISPGLGSDPHYEHQPGRVYNPPVLTKIILTRKAD